MNRNEEVCLLFVGNGGARLQRDKSIIIAGVNHFRAQTVSSIFAQLQCDIQHQIFFRQAIGPDGAGVVTAMACIHHDLADLQSQRANQRTLTVRRGSRGVRGGGSRGSFTGGCISDDFVLLVAAGLLRRNRLIGRAARDFRGRLGG